MLADRLDQLACEHVPEVLKALIVWCRQVDIELIGRNDAAHAHGPVEVHFPGQAPTELDRLQLAPEGLGKGPFDHALQTALELPESHAGDETTGRLCAYDGTWAF
jgi:hypothetical protein